MTKNQFRVLVVVVFAVSIFGGIVDLLWPNEITEQITAFAEEVEPEWSDTKLYLFVASTIAVLICLVGSAIGLILFKKWGRTLFLLGFIAVLPLYIPLGTTVSSPISQLLYDLASYGEGAILVLCYFSPVARYFENEI